LSSSASQRDRAGAILFRETAANPRKALLEAEAAIATARATAAQTDKALQQARELAKRVSELAEQGAIPQKELFSSEAELASQEARRERALIDLDQAERQAALAREDLAAQVELLKYDLDAAALNLEQSSREEARMQALFAQKAISVEEADVKTLALQQARLQYQRAKTLYDLYRKALPDSGSAGDKRTTDEKSATKRGDPFGTGKKE
jgi:multidrug resistance efflux pump